jgi:hypothetical protein
VEQVLNQFVQEVQNLYGSDLLAVSLYGSATTGEHVPGRSDINVVVVLSRLTPALLRDAVDVFPIEFLEMQTHHRTLWGPDLLASLRIGAEALRRQCEHELRGKLLRLRQAYVESAGSPKDLEAVLVSAATGLVVLARTLLYLARAEERGSTEAILDRVKNRFGVSAVHLRKAWQLKRGEIRVTGSELEGLYQAVLEEFQRLVQVVDALPA